MESVRHNLAEVQAEPGILGSFEMESIGMNRENPVTSYSFKVGLLSFPTADCACTKRWQIRFSGTLLSWRTPSSGTHC